ncbi:MAG TPA: calcium-translocating P-type ATPase [Gemmatimonadaceae bacterium]|nr:calcium-translocating P-type ATPase [Gemmatimonadaceae bacterium]
MPDPPNEPQSSTAVSAAEVGERDWHARPPDDVSASFGTDLARGLDAAEAARRLARDGANELLAEPPVPAWRRFVAQFESVLVLLLLVATAISLALWLVERDSPLPYDGIAILAIVLLNATMGFIQEARAERAVAALRSMSAAEATAIRDGDRRRLPARELVAGDLLLVEEGDTVPADARVVQSVALQAAEAALTGESLPVDKGTATLSADTALADRTNMLFSGTAVTFGRGRAVVVATGMRTEMGRIAGMLGAQPEESTPLQRELDHVGRVLGVVVVGIAAAMIAAIMLVHQVRGVSALVEVLLLGVALAVAAVPEGLPTIVTAVLAVGVRRMARRNAIVRRLAAVETLGAATVIASDKTGTLTRNEMTVRAVVTASGRVRFAGAGYDPVGEVVAETPPLGGPLATELERVLTAAYLANNAALHQRDGRWHVQGDPTEGALLVAAHKAGLDGRGLVTRWPRVGELPFSSERKLMSTVHDDAERELGRVLFTKGAPDVLLPRCLHELVGESAVALAPARRDALLGIVETLADDALRTLAVAYRPLDAAPADDAAVDESAERDLVFLGLVGMIDPPRAEAREAVRRAREAGIRPILITGDHPHTAAVIAVELGISEDRRVVTGAELGRLSDDDLARTVAEVSVYARVDPGHKLRIVDALQRHGDVVAMTGDGVNDAPALRSADIGVAMGIAGTDVSKEAADIVLADDDFATIVAAVEEGRGIYANIRRFLRFLLAGNLGEVITMFLGVVLAERLGMRGPDGGLLLPLLATQILWTNLMTDGAPALALGLDPAERGLMRRAPRRRDEGVLTPRMWREVVTSGLVMALGTLWVLDASLPGGFVAGTGTIEHARAMAFTTLVLAQLFNALNARSEHRSAFADLAGARWTLAAVALSVVLQAAVLYLDPLQRAFGATALSGADWIRCAVVASAVLWVRELAKLVGRVRSA